MPKEEEKREVKAGAIMVSLLASLDMFIYDFIEQLEAAGKYRFGNLLDYMWLRTPLKRVRLPQRRTIGKEHRGYAKSRIRIHQRRG
jgi:hypothetical protein